MSTKIDNRSPINVSQLTMWTAKESKKAAEDVSALVDEYKDLATNLSDSADAKSRLQQIQETLNTTYGIEDDKLDLVNGKYKEQLELLQGISAEKKAQSERDITEAYQKARDTQNSTYSMSIKHGYMCKEYGGNHWGADCIPYPNYIPSSADVVAVGDRQARSFPPLAG